MFVQAWWISGTYDLNATWRELATETPTVCTNLGDESARGSPVDAIGTLWPLSPYMLCEGAKAIVPTWLELELTEAHR